MLAFISMISTAEESEAVQAIYTLYYRKMRMIAYDVLQNISDAEDAVMDTFLYISIHPEQFIDYRSKQIMGLVFLKTKCAAIDIYRHNRKRADLFSDEQGDCTALEDVAEEGSCVVDIVINEETQVYLDRAVAKLEDMYRTPVVLHYYHGMKNTDIAEFLSEKVGKINSRLFRAKKRLKELMTEMGYVHESYI